MIMVLLGRSGSGKTTVAGILQEKYGYKMVRTCTTRNRRDGEPEDLYYFMSDEEFHGHLANDDFVEFDKYGDNFYGTLKSSLETDDHIIAILTPEGAQAIKNVFPDAFVVNVEADMKVSVLRAVSREKELDPGKMHRISVRATQDYYLYNNLKCDYVLDNSDGAAIERIAEEAAKAHEKFMEERKIEHV